MDSLLRKLMKLLKHSFKIKQFMAYISKGIVKIMLSINLDSSNKYHNLG
jgi:hypothetical protein